MMARAFLTWEGLGAGGGRTNLIAEDSSLLPPGPHIERGSLPRSPSPTERMGRNVAGGEGRALLMPT